MTIRHLITSLLCLAALVPVKAANVDKDRLSAAIERYAAGKDARIGVAVIIEGKDTVSFNGNSDFPMMSVFKFPQALAVAGFCGRQDLGLSDSISIKAGEIQENTWSPMREKYGVRDIRLPLREILEYSVAESDNNACDILFRIIGGPLAADSLMKSYGFNDISILYTESDMHADTGLCYKNSATPIEMARLFDRFYRSGMCNESPVHAAVGSIMTSCRTGVNRLPAPLKNTGAVIGHKTGTGDIDSQGRIMAINDAGYVFLPDGTGYAITVFVSQSALDMTDTERIIADIYEIVYDTIAE